MLAVQGFRPVQVSPNGIAQSQLAGTFAVGVNDLVVLAGGDVAVAGLRNVAGDDTAFAVARFTATDLADGPDTVPDPFAFTTQTGLETEIIATSNSVTIQGIDAPAAITVSSGDEYSIGCSDLHVGAGTISNGQTVCVRTTTPADGESDKRAFLIVGGVQGQFTVITGDATPDPFTFVDQTGVATNAQIVSAPVTLTGLTIRTEVRVSAGSQFSVGCTATTRCPTTNVDPGAQICVRHTSAATVGEHDHHHAHGREGRHCPGHLHKHHRRPAGPFTFVDQSGVRPVDRHRLGACHADGLLHPRRHHRVRRGVLRGLHGFVHVGCRHRDRWRHGLRPPHLVCGGRHRDEHDPDRRGCPGGVAAPSPARPRAHRTRLPTPSASPPRPACPWRPSITSGVVTIGGFDTATSVSA